MGVFVSWSTLLKRVAEGLGSGYENSRFFRKLSMIEQIMNTTDTPSGFILLSQCLCAML